MALSIAPSSRITALAKSFECDDHMRDKQNRPNVQKIEFERITAKHIQELGNKLDSTRPAIERTLAFCSATVRHYLGVEWLNKHVLPDSKHARYLRLDVNASIEEKQISIPRYLEFSESLLNLQDVEGFGFFLCKLMTEEVESCCAELDVARLLAVHELKFKFVPVQQKKGTDYDFEIFYPDGFMVHAEGKCKFEQTPVDLKSITNSLKKGIKAVPKRGASSCHRKSSCSLDSRRRRSARNRINGKRVFAG